jgi:glutamate dehydrogenase (NADP+)
LNEDEAKALANGCICVAEGHAQLQCCFSIPESKLLFSIKCWWCATSGLEMSQNSLRLISEEVDEKLKGIMLAIHASCVKYGLICWIC